MSTRTAPQLCKKMIRHIAALVVVLGFSAVLWAQEQALAADKVFESLEAAARTLHPLEVPSDGLGL